MNSALERLSAEYDALYAAGRRNSIAPEKLLWSLLPQAFQSVRSERRLMEQVTHNMLFRWFIGLSMDALVWDVTVFTKNRDRLLRGEVAGKFFTAVLADPQVKPLLSSEHFSMDGMLIEAWASMKSFRPKDGSGAPPGLGRNGERDFHGKNRARAVERLFAKFDATLRAAGYLAMGGQIVDATIVAAPKQRDTEAERAAIKAGQIPQSWAEKPAKLHQKDRDASWTVKFSKARPRDDGVVHRSISLSSHPTPLRSPTGAAPSADRPRLEPAAEVQEVAHPPG